MSTRLRSSSFLSGVLVLLVATSSAFAQDATSGAPDAGPRLRPTIAIAPFETDRTGWVPPPNFGETVADLLSSRLVELGVYRVFDRTLLSPRRSPDASFDELRDAAERSGVDFVVLGAVTRFGNEKKNKRGGLLGIPFLGGGGKSSQESTVGLTLRVLNVRTGEVVATSTSVGAAGKSHRTLAAGGLVKGVPVGGLFTSSSSGSLDRLVSEALVDAVDAAAATLAKSADVIGRSTN